MRIAALSVAPFYINYHVNGYHEGSERLLYLALVPIP